MQGPRKIIVVRALPGLGDFLTAVPALRSLRTAHPEARIDLVGPRSSLTLAQRFKQYLDHLLEFPGYPGVQGVPADLHGISAFLERVRDEAYDVAIQMHGDGTYINGFALALGAKATFGYHRPGRRPPDPERFLPYPADESEVRRNLRLVRLAGADADDERLEFPLTPLDYEELRKIPLADELEPGSYAILHPGASDQDLRWSPEHFAQVGDRLAAGGVRVVVSGTAEEAPLTAAVMEEMDLPALNLAGLTSLGSLAALISGAALVVANDAGVSKLAEAFSVPSIIVFSASDPHHYAPLDAARHRVASSRNESPFGLTSRLLPSRALFFGDRIDVVGTAADEVSLHEVMAELEDLLAMGGGDIS